jgi:hypothetical protein
MSEVATQGQSEQTFVANSYGTVTSKRVIYFRSKSWFSGGSREDIPLQHVTSVRLDTSRSILAGILFLLIGLGCLPQGGGATVAGVVILALAVLMLMGSPSVVVNTAGRDLNAAKGAPWTRGEANAFVEALRHQMFKS